MSEQPELTHKENYFRNFFFGKKESLLQSVVDGAIKAVFSGIVVSFVGLFILDAAESSIERSKKRAALQEFQNSVLAETLNVASSSFSELHCARGASTVIWPACKEKLDTLIGYLKQRNSLLAALIPEGDFASIINFTETAMKLKSLTESTPPTDRKTSTRQFSKDFSRMVNEVAKHFE